VNESSEIVLSQSAQHQSPPAATLVTGPSLIQFEGEMVIDTSDDGCPEYFGSRAQLEGEGLIPEGTIWPEGRVWLHWTTKSFRFSLFRSRWHWKRKPEDAATAWMKGDWWCLRWQALDAPSYPSRQIQKKTRELAELVRSQSPEGRQKSKREFERYWSAQQDEAFQTFKKTFVPQRKKPGRPSKEAQS
jgi:hypothetical protein